MSTGQPTREELGNMIPKDVNVQRWSGKLLEPNLASHSLKECGRRQLGEDMPKVLSWMNVLRPTRA